MILVNKKGDEIDVQCQQYEVGLYVCIYKNGSVESQFGLDIPKETFLADLRKGLAIKGYKPKEV